MIYVSHCRTCGFVFRVAASRPTFSQRCPLCLSSCDPIAIEENHGRVARPGSRSEHPPQPAARLRSQGA